MKRKTPPRRIASDLLRSLARAGSAPGAAQARTYFKERVEAFGVAAPELRRIVREAWNGVRGEWTLADALSLCERLLPDPRLEARAAAFLFLERYAASFEPPLLARIRRWIESGRCDSWATIDTLCPCVLGPLLERHPALLARTRRWTASRKRWVRRAALVSLVKHARHGERLDAVYDFASLLRDDEDDLVQKACGWLLREAGRTDPRRLERFLLARGPSIRRTTLRYAIERFPATARRRLLERTRPAAVPRSRSVR